MEVVGIPMIGPEGYRATLSSSEQQSWNRASHLALSSMVGDYTLFLLCVHQTADNEMSVDYADVGVFIYDVDESINSVVSVMSMKIVII